MIGAPLLPAQCNRSERVHKALFRTRTEAKEAVFEEWLFSGFGVLRGGSG